MATKPKTAAKKTAKTAAKKTANTPLKKTAKAAPKKTVKARAKKALTAAKPVKAVAKKPGKPAVKPAKTIVAKAVPAKTGKSKAETVKASAKAVPVKAVPAKAPIKVSGKPGRVSPGRPPKIVRPATIPVPASTIVPSVRVTPQVAQPVTSPKDLAAAHEYLLSRSATRSEAPVIIDGRRLPSEEQILKMPEAQYMNQEQLAFFKFRLQQMERELLANAGETTEHLRETVIVPDPADRATIEEEHALELRTRDRERKLLKKVQSSLAAIESGDYGFCEETGDPIGIPRLLARPTATLSLEAQERREMKQKLFGD
jgi:DnaK suppressor protein